MNRSKLICELAQRNKVLEINCHSELSEKNVNKYDQNTSRPNQLAKDNCEKVRLGPTCSLLGNELLEHRPTDLQQSQVGQETHSSSSSLLGNRPTDLQQIQVGLYETRPYSSSSDSDSDPVYYDSDADPEYFPTTTDPIAKGLRKYLKLPKLSTRPAVAKRKFDDGPRPEATSNIVYKPTLLENYIALPSTSSSSEQNIIILHEAEGNQLDDPVINNRPNVIVIASEHNADVPESEPVAKKPRKRWSNPHPEIWKVNVNKSNRKLGLPYKSKKGKNMPGKVPKPVDCSKCFFQCTSHFSEDIRKNICAEFTSSSFEQQKTIILTLVTKSVVERNRRRHNDSNKPERMFSYSYFFLKEGEKIRVCKEFFLKTLSISNAPLKTAFSAQSDVSGHFKGSDKRGRKEPPNKTSKDWIHKIKAHIESFTTMESHYCRKDTQKKYLDSLLTISKMYELFREQYKDQQTVPKENVYRKVFCTEFNLSFFHCSKDRCLICLNYESATEDDKKILQASYEEHITRKTEANESKDDDKKRATDDPTFVTATFDLQKVLQIPVSNAGPVYYSRKLCVYNLTVYEAAPPNKAYCFCWSENNGKRGSCEIGTCILQWFKTLPTHVKEVSLFSDTCGGQNRNQFVAALFLYVVQNFHFDVIEHKFLEKGHTKMEVDSMHSAIEHAQQNVSIMCMRDWLTVFGMARTNRHALKKKKVEKCGYMTKELQFSDFIDLKDLATNTIENRTTDSEGKTVNWLNIKRLRYEKAKPCTVLFSYDCKGDKYQKLHVMGNQPGRPRKHCVLKNLYSEQLPIIEAKKKDLLKLCKQNIFPKEHHSWIQKLKTNKSKIVDKTPEPTTEEYYFEEDQTPDA